MSIEELFSPDKIYITVAILATVGLLITSILIGVTTRRRQEQVMNHCRYRPRKRLMEGQEKRCFDILINLFGDKFYVIPDVALSALLNHKVGTQDRHIAYGFIENRTVDFVLCNKRSMRPICAIKLGDAPAIKNHSSRTDRRFQATRRLAPTPVAAQATKDLGDRPQDLQKFFQSAHIPFVYLTKNTKMTRQNIIDEFSRVVYETSLPKRQRH